MAGFCDPKDAKDCVQPLLEGEKAPFSGQLLTHRRAARLAVQADGCEDRLKLAAEFEHEYTEQQVKHLELLRENDLQAHKIEVELLQKRLADAAGPWYERPLFVATISVLGTFGVILVAAKTLDASR